MQKYLSQDGVGMDLNIEFWIRARDFRQKAKLQYENHQRKPYDKKCADANKEVATTQERNLKSKTDVENVLQMAKNISKEFISCRSPKSIDISAEVRLDILKKV